MSEVSTSTSVTSTVITSTSSQGNKINQVNPENSVSPRQAHTQTPVNKGEDRGHDDPESVEKAVEDIKEYVQSIQRDLHFSVDKDSERTVIKVIDGGSGELIRQIPEEVFLELARKLNEHGELRFFDALG